MRIKSFGIEIGGEFQRPWYKKTGDMILFSFGWILISIVNDSAVNNLTCWREIALTSMSEEQEKILEEGDANAKYDVVLERLREKACEYSRYDLEKSRRK